MEETVEVMYLPPVPPSPPASSAAVRSSMVGNRSFDTKPEIAMREALTASGLKHFAVRSNLPGTPDIVFETEKVAVFVHGCYWHRCPYCSLRLPATNLDYWTAKFARTRARDKLNARTLRAAGWSVVIVWECKLRKNPKRQVRRVHHWLTRGNPHENGFVV